MVALSQEMTTILKEANATAVRSAGRVATLFVALGTINAIMLPNPAITEAVKTQTQLPPLRSRIPPSDHMPVIDLCARQISHIP